MKAWMGRWRPFEADRFGTRPVQVAPLAQSPAGPASQALATVQAAQKNQRGVERNLDRIAEAIGPETTLEALDEANESVEVAWQGYVNAAQEMEA